MKSTVFSFLVIFVITIAWTSSESEDVDSDDSSSVIDIKPFYQPGPESEKFTGGDEVNPHSRPYQVALKIHWKNEKFKFCSGSLISTTFVLTAAHCLAISRARAKGNSIRNIEVILGAHNIRELEPTQVRINTTEFIVHDDWRDPFYNDIALIKLPEEVTLNDNIALVSFPSKDELSNTFTGDEATVSGWGKDHDWSIITNPTVLRSTTNPIISQAECSWFYPHAVSSYQLCVSGERKYESCGGDSGGPLTVQGESGEILVGVVSFGDMFCSTGYPHVYTRVTSYIDWIQEHTEDCKYNCKFD